MPLESPLSLRGLMRKKTRLSSGRMRIFFRTPYTLLKICLLQVLPSPGITTVPGYLRKCGIPQDQLRQFCVFWMTDAVKQSLKNRSVLQPRVSLWSGIKTIMSLAADLFYKFCKKWTELWNLPVYKRVGFLI